MAIGATAGVLGTLVGLGGAFVVIPVLRLVYLLSPAESASISLVMVMANAASGTSAYLRQGRADVRTAVLVAVTGIPASILGAHLVRFASPATFDLLYGALLVTFLSDIVRRRQRREAHAPPRGLPERILVDRNGETFRYATSVPLVLASGVALGLVSSFFGVGGGMIFVMVFMGLFRMPPHVVTATSTLTILLTSPAGVAAHAIEHGVTWAFAAPLAIGGLIGGQFGPRIARRLPAHRLLEVLAVTILAAVLALVLKHVPFARGTLPAAVRRAGTVADVAGFEHFEYAQLKARVVRTAPAAPARHERRRAFLTQHLERARVAAQDETFRRLALGYRAAEIVKDRAQTDGAHLRFEARSMARIFTAREEPCVDHFVQQRIAQRLRHPFEMFGREFDERRLIRDAPG